jgi:hypothetical protein
MIYGPRDDSALPALSIGDADEPILLTDNMKSIQICERHPKEIFIHLN